MKRELRLDCSRIGRLAVALAAAITLAAHVGACTSGGRNDSTCEPPPESCDIGTPQMMPVEADGCLGAPVNLPQVCVTSVNRCSPSAGLGVVCAFESDGAVYVALGSDNDVLTAPGWRFEEYVPATIPSDQMATPSEGALCAQLACASACPGVAVTGFPFRPSCAADAGKADGSEAGD